MRAPLRVSESKIIAAVEIHYGISTAALSFLPLGNDSATAVYRLDASNGATWFCKLRTRKGFSPASLAVPQFLHAHGIAHMLAPMHTRDQRLWTMVDDLALTLYPFVEQGRTAASAGLTDSQWEEFGSVVRQFHSVPLPRELLGLLSREQFVPKQRELIPVLETVIARGEFANDAERELAEFWQSRSDLIHEVVRRADSLGARLRQVSAAFVLCHADMHTYNLLLDRAGEFRLVDWDEVILALPERDLMFVVGGISSTLVSPKQTALFLQGYAGTPLNKLALTYYRFAWAVQDIAAYGEGVYLLPESSEAARRGAVQGLMRLFAPGEIIEIAMASES